LVIGMPSVNEPLCPSPANVADPPIWICCSESASAGAASIHHSAVEGAVGTKRPTIPLIESANSSKSRKTSLLTDSARQRTGTATKEGSLKQLDRSTLATMTSFRPKRTGAAHGNEIAE
jgi:hypothetical protein